jgi:tetratricopeptide (TPR) repeat protein
MPIWDRLRRKKTPKSSTSIFPEEYQQLLRSIMEHPDQPTLIVAKTRAALQRFDMKLLTSQLEEAKQIQDPVSIVVDAAALTNPRVAYCGGKDLKDKDRIAKLVLGDQNLRSFSEINRHSADALFLQNDFLESQEHYMTALQYRPRYSYIISEQTYLTAPELAGLAWPQIRDPDSGQRINIRLTPDLQKEGAILTILYARLGHCFSNLNMHQRADEAFHICHWFLQMIEQYNIQVDPHLIAIASLLLGQHHFNTAKYQDAITALTRVKSIAEARNSQQLLAEAENYLQQSHQQLAHE